MITLRIALVSAGLSVPSSTALLADQLGDEARAQFAASGTEIVIEHIELRALGNDIMQYFLTGIPSPALEAAHSTIADAQGVIAVTPIFKASYSGLFKSFWDTVDEGSLAKTVVLPAATGGTARHSLAIESIRSLMGYLKGIVIPSAVFAATADFGSDATLPNRIRTSVTEFVQLTGALAGLPLEPVQAPVAAAHADAPVVPGAQVDGALVGENAPFDEAGGANSGSFFGVARGGVSPFDEPAAKKSSHGFSVTPFSQMLQNLQQS